MKISLALHLIGIVMWVGGLMIGTSALKSFLESSESELLAKFASKIWFAFIIPGLTIATLTGLYQVYINGVGFYMRQGWFHTKLTFLIILYVATYLLSIEISKIRNKGTGARSRIMMVHGMSGLVLIVAVFTTLIGR